MLTSISCRENKVLYIQWLTLDLVQSILSTQLVETKKRKEKGQRKDKKKFNNFSLLFLKNEVLFKQYMNNYAEENITSSGRIIYIFPSELLPNVENSHIFCLKFEEAEAIIFVRCQFIL